VQKVGEYQEIFDDASPAIFMPSKDLADTFRLKLLHSRNYYEIIANLPDCKRKQ
jgi:hypothetical protein